MGRVAVSLGRTLTDAEEDLVTWAKARPSDVSVLFGRVYPQEDEHESEGCDTVDLCVERVVGERIYAECSSIRAHAPPEVWELTEQMTRERLERQSADA